MPKQLLHPKRAPNYERELTPRPTICRSWCLGGGAFSAAAPLGFDVSIPKVLTVIVGEFLTGLDSPLGIDVDMLFGLIYLGITVGAAGVVDVPGFVVSSTTIDRPVVIHFKEVLATAAVGFFGGDFLTGVFNNLRTFGDSMESKETKSMGAAAHRK